MQYWILYVESASGKDQMLNPKMKYVPKENASQDAKARCSNLEATAFQVYKKISLKTTDINHSCRESTYNMC